MDRPAKPRGFGTRHWQTALLFTGMALSYMLLVNLSVGVVAMTSPSTSNIPTLNWTTTQIGTLSSMFYYGYLFGNFGSGVLVSKFSPSKLLSSAGIFCGLTTVIFPYTALNIGYAATCLLRCIQGLGQGFFYPGVSIIMSKWAVVEERGKMLSVAYSGTHVGTIVTLSAGGLLADTKWGWPSIFYITGGLGVLWGISSLIFMADSPAAHRTISKVEREWIETGLPETRQNSQIPWLSILTSFKVWMCAFEAVSCDWGFATLLTLMPYYFEGVLGFGIKTNGFISCAPYAGMFIMCLLSSPFSDWLIERKYLSVAVSRKMWNSLAMYTEAVVLILLGTISFGKIETILLFLLSNTAHAFVFSGWVLVPLDLAPNFSGIVMGFVNGMSNIGSIGAPTVAGLIVTDKSSESQWQIVFLLVAVVYIVGNTVFILFGSSDPQPWDERKSEKTKS